MEYVDLLSIAGINHVMFSNAGDDIRIEEDHKHVARVFRSRGQIVYRAGNAFDWDDESGHPVN